MQIPVSEARGKLTEVVRRAEAGDKVELTRHGKATFRLAPMRSSHDAGARRAVIAAVQAAASDKRTAGVTAARSQDFLHDENGLPR